MGVMEWGKFLFIKKKILKCYQTKPLDFLFVLLKLKPYIKAQKYDVFTEPLPNSVRTNRPLLESISDEKNHVSNVVCILPIKNKKEMLMQNRMNVKTNHVWICHKFSFFNSMVDDKRDRGDSGLQGSLSKYLCTLCDADKHTAKELLESFVINRSVSECTNIAEILRVNPNVLSENELKILSKGVKSAPLTKIEPIQKGIDATHADISLGQLLYVKLLGSQNGNSHKMLSH